jgi:hypothetical protein
MAIDMASLRALRQPHFSVSALSDDFKLDLRDEPTWRLREGFVLAAGRP